MAREIFVLWWLLSPVGLILLSIGIILQLCESSWRKPWGSMGAFWFLGVGALLSLPTALYLFPALVKILRRPSLFFPF
jgi:hypothetical protein